MDHRRQQRRETQHRAAKFESGAIPVTNYRPNLIMPELEPSSTMLDFLSTQKGTKIWWNPPVIRLYISGKPPEYFAQQKEILEWPVWTNWQPIGVTWENPLNLESWGHDGQLHMASRPRGNFVDDPMEGGSKLGDSRQEMVSIGFGMEDPKRQEHIQSVLNQCLFVESDNFPTMRTQKLTQVPYGSVAHGNKPLHDFASTDIQPWIFPMDRTPKRFVLHRSDLDFLHRNLFLLCTFGPLWILGVFVVPTLPLHPI